MSYCPHGLVSQYRPPKHPCPCPAGLANSLPDCYQCIIGSGYRIPGVSPRDDIILRLALAEGMFADCLFWLRVPVTGIEGPEEWQLTPRMRAFQESIWPHRVDLITLDDSGYTVIEIKPTGSYMALGQLLFYKHHAAQHYACLQDARYAVLTDKCEHHVRPLYAEYDIDVIELAHPELVPPYLTK